MSVRAPATTELRICELYRSGLSIDAVSVELGVGSTCVRNALIRHGVPRRPKVFGLGRPPVNGYMTEPEWSRDRLAEMTDDHLRDLWNAGHAPPPVRQTKPVRLAARVSGPDRSSCLGSPAASCAEVGS